MYNPSKGDTVFKENFNLVLLLEENQHSGSVPIWVAPVSPTAGPKREQCCCTQ